MKCLVSKGFKYLVALFIILSCVSVRAMAKETNDTADQSNRITEKGNTSKDETFDTNDELMSNDPKKSISSQDSASDKGKNEASSTKDSVKTEYTFEDSKIKVKAVLKKADAVSDQAELKVKEIPENTTEYKKYENALNKKDNAYSNVLLYDISFMLNGKEVEPADGSVKVSMEFKEQQLSDDLKLKSANDLKVIHFKDNDVNKQESLTPTTNVKSETTSFETKSFSTYAVVKENSTTKNAYSLSGFQIPDYGYGVTANNYYQGGDTESNVFVGNYNSTASEVGVSQRYSNTGGYNYFGNIGSVANNLIRFHSKPAKVYLGDEAFKKYTNGNFKFDTNWVDTSVISHKEMSVASQLQKMDDAYDSVKNMTVTQNDKISSINADNPVEIDLSNQDSGTYVVKFEGNKIEADKLTVKINEGQHLIFYCTTNGSLDIQRYKLDTYTTGDTSRINKACSYYVQLEANAGQQDETNKKYDWVNQAVSFYAPEATELKFTNDSVCGVFVATNANFTASSNANAGIMAVNSYGTSDSFIGNEFHYHNHDLPTPDSTKFNVKKAFTDNNWPDETSIYNVKLEKLDSNSDTQMPTNSTLSLSKNNPTGTFGTITYKANSQKKNREVTYKYKLTEEKGKQANVTYDDTEYHINVKVKYSDNGSADVVSTTYTSSKENTEKSFDDNSYFTFTNSYSTFSASAELTIKKTVNGLTPGAKTFTFSLDEGKKENGKFVKTSSVQENVKNNSSGNGLLCTLGG